MGWTVFYKISLLLIYIPCDLPKPQGTLEDTSWHAAFPWGCPEQVASSKVVFIQLSLTLQGTAGPWPVVWGAAKAEPATGETGLPGPLDKQKDEGGQVRPTENQPRGCSFYSLS